MKSSICTTKNTFVWSSFLLVFLQILKGSSAQNCGFPSGKVILSAIKESFSIGSVIEEIRVVHVKKSSQDVPCKQDDYPEDDIPFVRIETFKDNQTLRIILLQDPEKLIDQYKYKSCFVTVKIPCTDGRKKEIKLEFPLQDLNTKQPFFYPEENHIFVQLPWNCNVPLNFNHMIVIKDQDRDLINADINFSYDENSDITAVAIPRYLDDLAHAFSVNLYLLDTYCESYGTKLSAQCKETNITVFNGDPRKQRDHMTVRLTFLTSSPQFDLAPEFKQNVYRVFIKFYEWIEGAELVSVLATDPEETSNVVYELLDKDNNGKSYFDIKCNSLTGAGDVSLKARPSLEYVTDLEHQVGIYTIRASQTQNEKFTDATLLVFFDKTPAEFECTKEGNFTDPEFCNVFHVCTPFEDSYQDERFCCPYVAADKYLIFCDKQKEPKCDFAEELGCNCESNLYDVECQRYTTDQPTTENSEATTTNPEIPTPPPGPFECYAEGLFGDPDFCNIFHQCVPFGKNFTHYRKCCAYAGPGKFLDYCDHSNPSNQSCLTREDAQGLGCACEHDTHDKTCPGPTTEIPVSTILPTESTSSISTTERPGEFECVTDGKFRDPVLCNVYYVCQFCQTELGCFKNRMCCSASLFFCDPLENCIYDHQAAGNGCPCSPVQLDPEC